MIFETLMRVHRMGEGVGYTQLKERDSNPEEGIEAAEIAIERNSVNDILGQVDEAKHENINWW